jgi:para-aminobenzoate synthetase/4-amino-4-deoxychorismate lyase
MPDPAKIQWDSHNKPGFFLMDDWDEKTRQGITRIFSQPEDILIAREDEDILPILQQADDYLHKGYYLAGYLAYEAGLSLEGSVISCHACPIPLIWLGVYPWGVSLDYDEVDSGLLSEQSNLASPELNCSDSEYLKNFQKIQEYIMAGDVYQVNYTCKLKFQNQSSAWALFRKLRKSHPVCHSAYLEMGEEQILSFSPELFLRKKGNIIQTRPMKGTLSRGRFPLEDKQKENFLREDIKNRAENLMIVDLMRNDLGRLCAYGKVKVPSLFSIEKYPSVFQMTSLIEGELSSNVSIIDLLKATFPPGSVTGAPKIRAMEIIDELEKDSRGIYCGSLGFFSPDGDFLLNVSIRTIHQSGSDCVMGVGSGIVADSVAESELKEIWLKGSFLQSQITPPFQLLETMKYQKGYWFIEEHLERLAQSIDYFGWKIDKVKLRSSLEQFAQEEFSSQLDTFSARVRLITSPNGDVSITWTSLEDNPSLPVNLWLSDKHLNPDDIFFTIKQPIVIGMNRNLKEPEKKVIMKPYFLITGEN